MGAFLLPMTFAIYNFALFFFAFRILDNDSVANDAAASLVITLISCTAYALAVS